MNGLQNQREEDRQFIVDHIFKQSQSKDALVKDLAKKAKEFDEGIAELSSEFVRFEGQADGLISPGRDRSRMSFLSNAELRCLYIMDVLDCIYEEQEPGDARTTMGNRIAASRRYFGDRGRALEVGIRIWQCYRDHPDRVDKTLGTSSLGAVGEVREHCCAAIFWLVRALRGVRPAHDGVVRAPELDFCGGLVRIVLNENALESPQEGGREKLISAIESEMATFKNMRRSLSAAGVPLRAWLMEHQRRLFDLDWQATHEPAFSRQYLKRVAESMWTLSSRIFGEGEFSYEDLADHLREPMPQRAKRAARRVHVEVTAANHDKPLLWLGRDNWRWIYEFSQGSTPYLDDSAFLEEIIAPIDELKDPLPIGRSKSRTEAEE